MKSRKLASHLMRGAESALRDPALQIALHSQPHGLSWSLLPGFRFHSVPEATSSAGLRQPGKKSASGGQCCISSQSRCQQPQCLLTRVFERYLKAFSSAVCIRDSLSEAGGARKAFPEICELHSSMFCVVLGSLVLPSTHTGALLLLKSSQFLGWEMRKLL